MNADIYLGAYKIHSVISNEASAQELHRRVLKELSVIVYHDPASQSAAEIKTLVNETIRLRDVLETVRDYVRVLIKNWGGDPAYDQVIHQIDEALGKGKS